MQTFRARSGPFDQQLRFSIEEIDQLCRDALSKAKLLPSEPEPIRIDRFIEKYFGCQMSYEDLGEGVLGCTLFNTDGSVKLVCISDGFDEGSSPAQCRLRATIAHEAGHCLMHPSLFMAPLTQGRLGIEADQHENLNLRERRILCRDMDVAEGVGRPRAYDGRWWEWQANRAIGGLLLPKSLVAKSLNKFLNITSVTHGASLPASARQNAISHMAEVFEVNPIVARIRLDELYPDDGGQMSF